MPIFEYVCRACDHHFELLVRGGDPPTCPSCHSADLDRQLSVFAVTSARPASPVASGPAPCGRCGDPRGPGACSLN